MTIDEVIEILERVKDLTNEQGKQEIKKVLYEMSCWNAPPAIVEEKTEPVKAEEPKDRRSEERDPFEAEQKLAAELGLPVMK